METVADDPFGAVTIVSMGSLNAPTTDTVKSALCMSSATINNTTLWQV
jgi:hypothetical protein